MVASYLTGSTITPVDAVAWCGNSYYKPGAGTYWSYFQAACEHFGCGSVTQTTDANAVLQALSEGRPVISSQGPGLCTSAGHFIVLRGLTADGKVLVNDPNDSINAGIAFITEDRQQLGLMLHASVLENATILGLREKIKDHANWSLTTVWGIGYKWKV